MKKIYLFIFLSTLILNPLFSQSVTGKISSAKNGELIIGATILQKGTIVATQSDYNGRFKIDLDLNTPKTLIINYFGFIPKEIVVDKNNRYVDVSLTELTFETKEVTVSANRLNEKIQESPVTIERMNIAAIKSNPAVGFYEGLANLKGVDMTTASLGFKVINTRGFNSTSPVRTLQLIDGMDNQSPGLNFAVGNFVGSSELDIESVDIVVGANSATYGPNAFNGVINMTTKDPFKYRGLNVSIKGGSRNLFEGSFRYAKVFKEKFAFKVNGFYLNAIDFEAKNDAPIDPRNTLVQNPKNDLYGYNAINTYGEVSSNLKGQLGYTDGNGDFKQDDSSFFKYPHIFRTGYKEKDLTNNYTTNNLKFGGGLFYKITDKTTLSYSYNFGTGTTIYQGENRYSIKGILFHQHKIELKGERFYLRSYGTFEDAGNSYDIVYTATKLLNSVKGNDKWFIDFTNGYRGARDSGKTPDESLKAARIYADTFENKILKTRAMLIPGTPEFEKEFKKITENPSFRSGGTRFQDNSNLLHYQGEYNFNLSKIKDWLPADFKVGGNFRQYNPKSYGTIFSDTLIDRKDESKGFTKISVYEYGTYVNTEKKFLNEKLNFIGSIRYDAHQNFKSGFSPAISAVVSPNKTDRIRLTYTTALRNPTLQDQYLRYDIGFIQLLGNVDGKDIMLLKDFRIRQNNTTYNVITHVDAVKPERVRSLELGYKGIVAKKVYMDISGYYSVYRDFIGFVIGFRDPRDNKPPQAYRVATNAHSQVTTVGASLGLDYYLKKYFSVGFNFSYNELVKKNVNDPLVPNFNTPKYKYNVSFKGKEIHNFGFGVNYKFVQGFDYTGSPQFTGYIPSYGLVDAQINYTLLKLKSVVKLGCSNLFDNQHFEAYGGPNVGRIAYLSINFEL